MAGVPRICKDGSRAGCALWRGHDLDHSEHADHRCAVLAAPGVAVMLLFFNRPLADWCALVFFIGAALTDYFDG